MTEVSQTLTAREVVKLGEVARQLVQAEGRLKAGAGEVAKHLHGAGVSLDDIRKVTALTNEVGACIFQARKGLGTLGASGHDPATIEPETLSLSLLAGLSNPDLPELLDLLQRAQVVAERIDSQRGRVVGDDVPLLPGESRGTDLAEAVSELAQTVRSQVCVPVGIGE
jgi:hypothetical protein